MNDETALKLIKRRKKALIEYNKLLLERLGVNNRIREINKELNGYDKFLVNSE